MGLMTKKALRKDQKRNWLPHCQWIRLGHTVAQDVAGAINWHSRCSVTGGNVTSLDPCPAQSVVLFTTVQTTCRTTSSLPTTWEAGFHLALDKLHRMSSSPTSYLALTKNRAAFRFQCGTVVIELKMQTGNMSLLPGRELRGLDEQIKHYCGCNSTRIFSLFQLSVERCSKCILHC